MQSDVPLTLRKLTSTEGGGLKSLKKAESDVPMQIAHLWTSESLGGGLGALHAASGDVPLSIVYPRESGGGGRGALTYAPGDVPLRFFKKPRV